MEISSICEYVTANWIEDEWVCEYVPDHEKTVKLRTLSLSRVKYNRYNNLT